MIGIQPLLAEEGMQYMGEHLWWGTPRTSSPQFDGSFLIKMVHGGCWRPTLLCFWTTRYPSPWQGCNCLGPKSCQSNAGYAGLCHWWLQCMIKYHLGTDLAEGGMGKGGKREYGNFIVLVDVYFSMMWYGCACEAAHIYFEIGTVRFTVDKCLSLSLHSSRGICWSNNTTTNAGLVVGAE